MTPLRVLLTEDATPSARQILTVLGWHGHHVEALSSGGQGLTRFSRYLAHRHRVPPMGLDPNAYFTGLLRVLRAGNFDVVLPTHEQVAVLARHRDRLAGLVAAPAVPAFETFARVIDKVAAFELLSRLDIPQPATAVATRADQVVGRAPGLPCFVKLPMATASRGVWRAENRAELVEIADRPEVRDAIARGPGVLVQQAVDGELVMVQTVFDHGRLRAGHAAVRLRIGVGNAASAKQSVAAPEILDLLGRLGAALEWHGALSADVIVDRAGHPHVIDLNPRLVEPVNAELAGVGLVDAMLDLSGPSAAPGRTGVRTSMTLMALLRHGETGAGRRAVLRELTAALRRTGTYENSAEELLGVRGDRRSALLTAAVAAALLVRPDLWRPLARSSATDALTVDSWRQLAGGDD